MTFGDHDSIDDDILDALRADARRATPHASRQRVLQRLAVGVGALGAAGTLSTGACALAASVVGSHGTIVLVSTLAVGIGIGFGARSGLDAIRAPEPSHVAAPRVAAPRVAPRAAVRAPSPVPPSTAVPALEPAASSVASPEPTPAPLAIAPSTLPAPAAREHLAIPAPALLPQASEPTTTLPPPVPPPGLADQQRLLDEARSALIRHDGAGALTALAAHRQRFRDTTLVEERAALEVRALVVAGRGVEARERLSAFERSFPRSLFGASLRRLVVNADDKVTDPLESTQSGK